MHTYLHTSRHTSRKSFALRDVYILRGQGPRSRGSQACSHGPIHRHRWTHNKHKFSKRGTSGKEKEILLGGGRERIREKESKRMVEKKTMRTIDTGIHTP